MTEIVLFHHACGLTPGVHAFADQLRAAGHIVHTPDLFEGRTFEMVEAGEPLPFQSVFTSAELEDRAAAATEPFGTEVVFAGMSLGVVFAAGSLLQRGGAKGALFLYGAIDPAWWPTPWPAGVPTQSHQTADDPWRESEADEEYQAKGIGEFFLYPGSGHLFLEAGHAQFEPEAAQAATECILTFLAGLD